jgi:quinol-cytochrome oxidoreductase complex cytochrome b subunit
LRLLTRVRHWLDERFHWADLIAPLQKKTVPIHGLSYWYFLGGITLFLFGIQVCTGFFYCCTTARVPMKPLKARSTS